MRLTFFSYCLLQMIEILVDCVYSAGAASQPRAKDGSRLPSTTVVPPTCKWWKALRIYKEVYDYWDVSFTGYNVGFRFQQSFTKLIKALEKLPDKRNRMQDPNNYDKAMEILRIMRITGGQTVTQQRRGSC